MDKQERENRIAGLLRERAGYLRFGNTESAAAVDVELKNHGYEDPDAPQKKEEPKHTPPQGRSARPPMQVGQVTKEVKKDN